MKANAWRYGGQFSLTIRGSVSLDILRQLEDAVREIVQGDADSPENIRAALARVVDMCYLESASVKMTEVTRMGLNHR